jgi:hypothetical protein
LANNQELEERYYGISLAFPRLIANNDGWQHMSGGFSYFDEDNMAEISLPWLYSKENWTSMYNKNIGKSSLRVVTIDLEYKRFLREFGALYLSGFTRFANLRGKDEKSFQYKTINKLGIGIGFGYRYFYTNYHLYWGVGLKVGRYLTGNNREFVSENMSVVTMDDQRFIIDIEVLKLGYYF